MKTVDVKKPGLFLTLLKEKCPNCGCGNVYKESAGVFQMPVMNETCSACHYRFDREPGYFLGAMYVSYGIAVAAGIITFLLLNFLVPDIPTIWVPIVMIAVIVAISKKNFKLSRIIYMRLFPW